MITTTHPSAATGEAQLPLGDLALEVQAARCVVADLGDRGDAQRVVQLMVPRGLSRCDAPVRWTFRMVP